MLSNDEWLKRFRQRAIGNRIPITGTLELTSRCNLKCVHCYLGSQEEQRQKRDLELSTEQVFAVIDELAAAGCLFLLITGGDPMMRSDFERVYRHAKSKGLFVTIFCDGVLVNERVVELFRELPPFKVEISLYGATEETYEKITQVKGSFKKCIRGVERLLAAEIIVGVKTVLMTLNAHEVPAMTQMAADWGVPFHMDSAIFPCLPDSDQGPISLRVEPEKAVEIELGSPDRLESWKKYYREKGDAQPTEDLYTCGAAVTSFYVDPFGNMSPCLMTTQYRYSLLDSSFFDRWHKDLPEMRKKKPGEDYGCNTCQQRVVCGGCPAFHYLETGREDVRSSYVCETTGHRYRKILEALRDDA